MAQTFSFRRTPQFARSYRKIKDQQAKKAVDNTLKKMAKDPYHPSLRTSKLVKSKPEMDSRVTRGYRIVWQYDEENKDTILLLNVDSHRIVE